MKNNSNPKLYETILHKTDTAPYSIHYTEAEKDYEPVLYLHWHDEMEFLLLTQGHIYFHIEDRVYELHAGEAIFIPPGLLHYANNAGHEQPIFYAFVLSGEFLFPSMDTYSYNTYVLPVMHNNLSLASIISDDIFWQKDILQHLTQIFFNHEPNTLFVRGHAMLLWDNLYNYHIHNIKSQESTSMQSESLINALSYIQKNYEYSITLKQLAQTAHLSEGQFCRSFKEFTGLSPFHYLIRYRILQSCTLLLETNHRITQIALSCGFNNVSYYNRAFQKLMNMTPKEYRKSTAQ